MKGNPKKLFILVEVNSGIPAEVKVFDSLNKALKQEKNIKKKINEEKDSLGLFECNLLKN